MLQAVAFLFLLCSKYRAETESSFNNFNFVLPSKQMIHNCLAAQREEVNALKLRVAELQYQLSMSNIRSELNKGCDSIDPVSTLESPRNPVFDCNCNNNSTPFMISFSDCNDVARLSGEPSGVYSISPLNGTGMQLQIQEVDELSTDKWNFLVVSTIGPMSVFCDIIGAVGWTVVMQRTNMDASFDQTWEKFKNGFGNMSHDGDFWLGLEKMHQLTNQMFRTFELQIVITDASGVPYIFPYSSIKIGSETENYSLHLGQYSGIISNPYDTNRLPFIARDKNTQLNQCCTLEHENLEYYRGWWMPETQGPNDRYHNSHSCPKRANLNAPHIYWTTNFGVSRQIAKVVMRIKPN